MKEIIVIEGGFGGVNFALGFAGNKDYEVTLIDRNNYNFFSQIFLYLKSIFKGSLPG